MAVIRNIAVLIGLCTCCLSHAETALVVNKDGLSGKASFGELVEVSVSGNGAMIALDGEEFPSPYVSIEEDGCFSVGISQGLGSVYEDGKFEGTGAVDSIEFTATIDPSIDAAATICPTLDAPLQLVAIRSQSQNTGRVQPMAIRLSPDIASGNATSELQSGESFTLDFDAFCLDVTKEPPGRGTELAPISKGDLIDDYAHYLNDPDLDQRQTQTCIWLSASKRFASQFEGEELTEFQKLWIELIVDEHRDLCGLTREQISDLMPWGVTKERAAE